jgi:predicted transcriptional regulator
MVACAEGGQVFVSEALVEDWIENDIDKIAYLNLKWCEQNHLVKKNDINHFKKIYQLKKWFYKNVTLNPEGMFRFKGFDKEQKLFRLSFSGGIDSIRNIDKIINASIQFSINEDTLRKRKWDYLWDNLGNMTEKICDKMDDEKLKIILRGLDKNNIASMVNFFKANKRKRIVKNVSGDDLKMIKFIQKRGCGATSDIYISWFREIINAAREIDGALVDEILSQLKAEDRREIEKYLSGGKVLGPVKNNAGV